jgi:hypothetical protein
MLNIPDSALTNKLQDVQNGDAHLVSEGTNIHYTVESINETQSTVDIVTPGGKSRRLTYSTIRGKFSFANKGSKQCLLTELPDR